MGSTSPTFAASGSITIEVSGVQSVQVCIIVRDSPWGQPYVKKAKQGHRFYRYARFYSLPELEELLEKHDFRIVDYKSTLTYFPSSVTVVENPRSNPRQGSLCAKAIKK